MIEDWFDFEKVSADILKKRQQFEIEQWQKWKQSGEKPTELRPLLQSMRPLIKGQVNVFKGRVRNIPPAAIEAEFNRHAMTAFRSYDPNRGAKLSTHVRNHLQKAKRFVAANQNLGYIPEHRVWNIGEFKNAQSYLQEQLGRQPTSTELTEHLGWTPAEVGRMQKEMRADLPASGFVDAQGQSTDPGQFLPSREREVMNLIGYELSPEEKLVYERTYGVGGQRAQTPGQIAKSLKFSPSKVSRLRKKIAGKIQQHLY